MSDQKQFATLAYSENGNQKIDIIVEGESIWATQKAICELFRANAHKLITVPATQLCLLIFLLLTKKV